MAAGVVYGLSIGVVLTVCTIISVVLTCLRLRREREKKKDESTLKNDKLEKKGGLWCLTRLLISIPLAAGVIAVATVPFDWGLDRTMLGRPIIYVPVGLADVVVFLECILFACCASRGTFFKNQGKVYLFYSLTLGFPFGTATKILWLLHAGGNAEIPTSYIPIPCIAGMAIATIVIFARLILACVCSETCRCREWNKTRLCCMSVLIIIAVAVFWLITFSLIHHTGVYEKDVKFHIDVWLICLLPVWSVAAVAFVYVTYRFWLLIVQICVSKSSRARVRYRRKLQLLYTTPDMCVVYGYLVVALALVSEADGNAAGGGRWFFVLIATEAASLCFTFLALCVPVCNFFTGKTDEIDDMELQSVATESIDQGINTCNTSSVLGPELQKTETGQRPNVTTIHTTDQFWCPSYWHLTGILTSHQHNFLQMVTVDDTTRKEIVNLMSKTWYEFEGRGGTRLGLRVNDVQQLENPHLLHQYLNHRNEVRVKHGLHNSEDRVLYITDPKVLTQHQWLEQKVKMDARINEFYLWHGTSQGGVQGICSHGFDPRLSAYGLFGSGVYFAEKSSKSNDYAEYPTGGSNYMFLTRVCLGNSCKVINHCRMKRPPCVVPRCRNDRCSHELHDSVLGDKRGSTAREFILYELHSCYPDYLIAYDTYPL